MKNRVTFICFVLSIIICGCCFSLRGFTKDIKKSGWFNGNSKRVFPSPMYYTVPLTANELRFRGKVKGVQVKRYGILIAKYSFNPDGFLVESWDCKSADLCNIKYYKYDENNRLIEMSHNSGGTVDSIKGKERLIRSGSKYNSHLGSISTFMYDGGDNVIEERQEDTVPELSRLVRYKYDARGHKAEECTWSAKGNLIDSSTHKYDNSGNEVEYTITSNCQEYYGCKGNYPKRKTVIKRLFEPNNKTVVEKYSFEIDHGPQEIRSPHNPKQIRSVSHSTKQMKYNAATNCIESLSFDNEYGDTVRTILSFFNRREDMIMQIDSFWNAPDRQYDDGNGLRSLSPGMYNNKLTKRSFEYVYDKFNNITKETAHRINDNRNERDVIETTEYIYQYY